MARLYLISQNMLLVVSEFLPCNFALVCVSQGCQAQYQFCVKFFVEVFENLFDLAF